MFQFTSSRLSSLLRSSWQRQSPPLLGSQNFHTLSLLSSKNESRAYSLVPKTFQRFEISESYRRSERKHEGQQDRNQSDWKWFGYGGSGMVLGAGFFSTSSSDGHKEEKEETQAVATDIRKVLARKKAKGAVEAAQERAQSMRHSYSIQEAMKKIGEVLQKERGPNAEMWPRVRFHTQSNAIEFVIEGGYDCTEIVRMLLNALGPAGTSAQVSLDEKGWMHFSTHTGFSAGLFRETTSSRTHVWFEKQQETWNASEIAAVIETYMQGNGQLRQALAELDELGLNIYTPEEGLTWDTLAGADHIKEEIHHGVILPLKYPDLYDKVCQVTRKQDLTTNRPKAVLFDGPPGTGKTTTARIIASEVKVPLIYVPVESVVNKYYGESEKILSSVFEACAKLGNAIIFIDEIDSLATSRDDDMHEATRRVLSVLLRKIEGFEKGGRTIVIGATNRKQDLDAALLSRFDMSLHFGRPDEASRAQILANYAKHLNQGELRNLAKKTDSFTGRDLRDICAHAERSWTAKLIENEYINVNEDPDPPPPAEYIRSINIRKEAYASS